MGGADEPEQVLRAVGGGENGVGVARVVDGVRRPLRGEQWWTRLERPTAGDPGAEDDGRPDAGVSEGTLISHRKSSLPPSDCPLTAIALGSTMPSSSARWFEDVASIPDMTTLMSRGWLTRSDSSGPPGACACSRGKTGAATT